VNGDTPSCLSTQPALSTTATAASPVGTYPITVSGASAANYAISYVNGTLTVTKAQTSGVLISSANPALPGQSITFTFSASAVAPGAGTVTGSVTLFVDGVQFASGSLSGGSVSFSTAALTHGSHVISAEYAGSSNFLGTSATLSPAQLVNTPPVAGPDTVSRFTGRRAKISISTLLQNDYDNDSDPLSVIWVSPSSAKGGTITQLSDWIIYNPPAGLDSTDTFTYQISDGQGAPVTGTVTVAVVADTAAAPNLTISLLPGGSFLIKFNGVPNKTYTIQYSEDPASGAWTTLGTATSDAFGDFQFIDTPQAGSPMRIYRSVYP